MNGKEETDNTHRAEGNFDYEEFLRRQRDASRKDPFLAHIEELHLEPHRREIEARTKEVNFRAEQIHEAFRTYQVAIRELIGAYERAYACRAFADSLRSSQGTAADTAGGTGSAGAGHRGDAVARESCPAFLL